MGKNKTAQALSAKKVLKKVIALQLVKELTDITGKISDESKDLTKAIEKGAKKLAKKVSKEIKPVKAETPKTDEVKSVTTAPIVAATTKPAIKNPSSGKVTPVKQSPAKTTVNK